MSKHSALNRFGRSGNPAIFNLLLILDENDSSDSDDFRWHCK